MPAADGQGAREHWLVARLPEVLVVAVVWGVVCALRILSRGANLIPYEVVGTTVNLIVLGALMAVLVAATGILMPDATRRLVPAVAALMGAGYAVVFLTAEPALARNPDQFDIIGERSVIAHFIVGVAAYVVVLILARAGHRGQLNGVIDRVQRSWRVVVVGAGSAVVLLFGAVFLTAAGQKAATIALPGFPQFQPGDLIRVLCIAGAAVALNNLGARLRLDAERPGRVIPFLRLPRAMDAAWAVGVPLVAAVLFGIVGDVGPAIVLAFGTAFLAWFATDHLRYLAATLLFLLFVAVTIPALPVSLGTPTDRFGAWVDFDVPEQLAVEDVKDCPSEPPPATVTIPPDAIRSDCFFGPANEQVARARMLTALGGIAGVGVGSGRAYQMVTPQTDSVIAVLGESVGVLGMSIVLMALMVVCLESLGAGIRARGSLGLLVAGIGMLYAVQGVLIAGGILGYLPLTGVTFPLVSAGGSSTVTFLAAVAVVVSVSDRPASLELDSTRSNLRGEMGV